MILYTQFEKVLSRYDLLHNSKKVILAVSGGVDSIVLFHLMQKIPKSQRPAIIVAHVNHQLRPESKQEEDFVRNLAKVFEVSFRSYTWSRAIHPESGIEEAARTIRYTFFKEVMADTLADVVMTAHHQDDQVETVLMKLTRGSSLEQILGIEESQDFEQGQLIRPMLSFSKENIYRFAKKHAIHYMEDSTNQELDFARNRFRNTVIPLLKEENQQFNEHINQFRLDLEDLLHIASAPIDAAYHELVTIDRHQLAFHLERFKFFDEPMQRALLHKMLEATYEGQAQQYKANYIGLIQEWLRVVEGNSRLDLAGGFHIEKSYDHIVIYKPTNEGRLSHPSSTYTIEEDTTHRITLSETESIVLSKVTDYNQVEALKESKNHLVFHADSVVFPLTVRHRLPGDRMSYQGLAGTKKVKDIFIDEKVPLKERDEAWLVEDATGKIIWLISYREMYLLSQSETDKLTYILKYMH